MQRHLLFFYVAMLSIGIVPQAVAQPYTNTVAGDTQLPKAGSLEAQTKKSNSILQSKNSEAQLLQPVSDIPRLSEVEHPHTSMHLLTQQPVPIPAPESPAAEVVKVTSVRLSPIPNGLEVILETPSGQQLQVLTANEGNTFIAQIPNAQLTLPQSNQFRANNPVKGIAAVTVTNLNANSIQVRVTGTADAPKVEVSESDEQRLIFSLTPASQTGKVPPAPAPQTPVAKPEVKPRDEEPQMPVEPEREEEIEIVVTAEQEQGYRVPEATSATRTETPLQDIPQSIQVIPEQVLEDQQVNQGERILIFPVVNKILKIVRRR